MLKDYFLNISAMSSNAHYNSELRLHDSDKFSGDVHPPKIVTGGCPESVFLWQSKTHCH